MNAHFQKPFPLLQALVHYLSQLLHFYTFENKIYKGLLVCIWKTTSTKET